MQRRAILLSIVMGFILPVTASAANTFIDYKPGLINKALEQGRTVFVDYYASWCPVCRRQERVVSGLIKDNPDYSAKITFVRVDWETYKSHSVRKNRKIPRRSTLLMLRGNEELGRIVAATGTPEIKALLDKGM